MWQILFSLFNLIQMTIEPCPPQESFCATWAGNFGTFDKGIQWGLECSPGKRSKGGRAEDRESTTETPPNNSFWSKIFLTKMFFPKSTFPPHFAKWYDHWLKWQSSYVTILYLHCICISSIFSEWIKSLIQLEMKLRKHIKVHQSWVPGLQCWLWIQFLVLLYSL